MQLLFGLYPREVLLLAPPPFIVGRPPGRRSLGGARYRLPLYLVIIILLAAMGAGGWLGRTALLQSAADLWVISDPITSADAVVVLGGGADVRPFVAADLYAKGLVHKVLVSQVKSCLRKDRCGP